METIDDRIHRAAAAGDVDAVRTLLHEDFWDGKRWRPKAAPNAPDDTGSTAMFYAQMNDHPHVVDELANHGWTRMPEGLIFAGPGGRKMFWSYNAAARFRAQTAQSTFASSSNQSMRAMSHRPGRRLRRTKPSGRHAIPYNIVGPAHRLYLRKAEGRRRLTAGATRPQLNTDDLETRLRFVDIDELLEEEGYHDEEAEAAVFKINGVEVTINTMAEARKHCGLEPYPKETKPEPLTLTRVARFVVERKPRQLADGGWVIMEPEETDEEEESALIAPLADDVMSLSSYDDSSSSFTTCHEELNFGDELAAALAYDCVWGDALESVDDEYEPLDDAAAWPALVPAKPLAPKRAASELSLASMSEQWEVVSNASEYEIVGEEMPAAAEEAPTPVPPKPAAAWADAARTRAAIRREGDGNGKGLFPRPLPPRRVYAPALVKTPEEQQLADVPAEAERSHEYGAACINAWKLTEQQEALESSEGGCIADEAGLKAAGKGLKMHRTGSVRVARKE